MMQLLALGGSPATGKSSLMKALMKSLAMVWSTHKEGLVEWEATGDYAVLGKYEPHKFPGTDRLSMACQPKVLAWLKQTAAKNRYRAVLFEGDRLFNKSFLTDASKIPELTLTVVVLRCPEDELKRRHRARKDTQDETWLRGRNSKVENVYQRFKAEAVELTHATPEDTQACVKQLRELLEK